MLGAALGLISLFMALSFIVILGGLLILHPIPSLIGFAIFGWYSWYTVTYYSKRSRAKAAAAEAARPVTPVLPSALDD